MSDLYGPGNWPIGKLNPKQFGVPLFHASPKSLKPGNILRPKGDDLVWAGDKERADYHAQNFLMKGAWGNSQGNRYTQLAFFHPVYEVEPLKTDKSLFRTASGQPVNKMTFASRKGFRVKRFSHFKGEEE